MLVSFSGIDSAGKTTQIQQLESYCRNNGIRFVRLWGKARGTPGVELLKSIFRRDKGMSFEQKMEYRSEVFKNSKKKKLLLIASLLDLCWYWGIYYRIRSLFYDVTVLDRYIWDTYIEVKTEFEGVDFEKWLLWKIVVAVSPKPKTSFLFVIPAEESIKRDIQKHDLTVDSLQLKKEKIDLYVKLKEAGKWSHIMDGMRTIGELHKQVKEILKI